jgi:hypothetical protein
VLFGLHVTAFDFGMACELQLSVHAAAAQLKLLVKTC